MNLETMARKRRERQRGTEEVHHSGLAIVRRAEDRRHVERLAARMAKWATEPTIEEKVEKDRHLPINGGPSRAQRDEWLRGICDAWED